MRSPPLAAIVLGATLLSGCASMLSASAPVLAILHDDLFTGTAVGYGDRTGTIDVVSSVNPNLRCVGNFAYNGSKTGSGQLRCNDGNVAAFQFNGLTMLSGYGYGTTTRGGLSFTFGLDSVEAAQYLTLPKGKALRPSPKDKKTQLVDA
jgi:hypothetical protein